MSSITWTASAVASELRPFKAEVWRAVEAQHEISTLKLCDTVSDQWLLEDILEESKPALPPETKHLDYLMFSPFRYVGIPYGSRFRSPGGKGVFYAGESQRVACAELGYWRQKFLKDSEGLSFLPEKAHTIFSVKIAARTVDLTSTPFDRDRAVWTDREDYRPTQMFAETAREAGAEAITYESVRDPEKGLNTALLEPSGFSSTKPVKKETWHLIVYPEEVYWHRDKTRRYVFRYPPK